MFKLTNQTFNHPMFMQTLYNLSNQKLPAKVSWNISRMHRQCTKYNTLLRQEVAKLGAKYFKKDEKDEVIPIMKDGVPVPGHFETLEEGGQEKFDKEFADLLAIEVEIESYKIKLSDIENVEISASELSFLEPVIDTEEGLAIVD